MQLATGYRPSIRVHDGMLSPLHSSALHLFDDVACNGVAWITVVIVTARHKLQRHLQDAKVRQVVSDAQPTRLRVHEVTK